MSGSGWSNARKLAFSIAVHRLCLQINCIQANPSKRPHLYSISWNRNPKRSSRKEPLVEG
ncbi:hypothetical protein DPMN_040708 [Dreissena polymorpha]|uniref:Uncharacterized protein n=1 Tax=Dreissena polymorpha TaxID=45954 RepID=A0A9D4CY60_DREPO|nr:hypothetical protein DPMN_040708 [Dreissena polymorpha]